MVSVDAEAGQAADTVVLKNILKMWGRLMVSARPGAIWVINQEVEQQLFQMSLAVGTGGSSVYMPAGGVSQSMFNTLMGKPVVVAEQAAGIGDTGDIILGDFGEYISIDKGGMKSDVSIHVQFLTDQVAFRFTYRIDGQPVLSQPITPAKGTLTQSHFVKLAAR